MKKKNKEQSKLDSRIQHNCYETTKQEPESTNKFPCFEVDLTQKVANFGRSFPTKKIKNREQNSCQHTSLAFPTDKNHPDAFYRDFLQKSSQIHRSRKVVNFDGNFQMEKFENQPPKRGTDTLQSCPKKFWYEKHQKFHPKLFNSQKTQTRIRPASFGQLNCAKKKRKTHRNPSKMIESSSLILLGSIRRPTITRRMIASNLGRVFDPLGLVTTVTIIPKILFRKTWNRVLEWDDDVGAHIANQFQHRVPSRKSTHALKEHFT